MKKIIAIVLSVVLNLHAHAQSRTSNIEYQKTDREAIVNEISFPEDMITKAIQDTLETMGYKGKENKGFMVYKGVKMPALGSEAYDLYFSVDKKSKREKDISNVTMMISKGFDAFVTGKSDPDLFRNAKTYLDSLRNTVAIYDKAQQVSEQEEVVKKRRRKSRTWPKMRRTCRRKRKSWRKRSKKILKNRQISRENWKNSARFFQP